MAPANDETVNCEAFEAGDRSHTNSCSHHCVLLLLHAEVSHAEVSQAEVSHAEVSHAEVHHTKVLLWALKLPKLGSAHPDRQTDRQTDTAAAVGILSFCA
jgi:hypothetical protein